MLKYCHPDFLEELKAGYYTISELAKIDFTTTRAMRRLLHNVDMSVLKKSYRSTKKTGTEEFLSSDEKELMISWPGVIKYKMRILKKELKRLHAEKQLASSSKQRRVKK